MAINRRDGQVAWERTAREEAPHEASHPDNGTWASSSAITDGEHVIAFFESRGLYAYDMDGKLVWEKDLGDKSMRNQFGEGSTPALHGNHLVVVWDHTAGSFIVALDKRTGNELWRVKRDEIDTWATPLIVEHAGRAQVIVPGKNLLHSYDLETGDVAWHSEGLTMNPIPSPVGADGMIFAASGFRGNNLKAIRLADASGDLTGSKAIVWSLDRDTPAPAAASPLRFFFLIYINPPPRSPFPPSRPEAEFPPPPSPPFRSSCGLFPPRRGAGGPSRRGGGGPGSSVTPPGWKSSRRTRWTTVLRTGRRDRKQHYPRGWGPFLPPPRETGPPPLPPH